MDYRASFHQINMGGWECEGVRIRDCEGRKGAESKVRIVRIIVIKYLTSRLNQGKY